MGKSKVIKLSLSSIKVTDEDLHGYANIRKLSISSKVRHLPIGAFSAMADLERVYLEANVHLTTIPEACFMNCRKLSDITPLPESVVSIGDKAFKGCTAIRFIHLPEHITYVSPSAFDGWKEDQTIHMEGDHVLSEKCKATVVRMPDEEDPSPDPVGFETDGTTKLYVVSVKGGHVGRHRYMPIDMPIKATSKKEAAAIARARPRVKHDHPDAILSVSHVSEEVFMETVRKNREDPYLHVRSKREQRDFDDEIDRRALPETRPHRRRK
jgi:hypothetical protein